MTKNRTHLDLQRFQQRLQNYQNAVQFLEEVQNAQASERLKETALIKAYEMAFELAWKTLKDFLEYGGFLEAVSPRDVLKESFKQGYLKDGSIWIKMLEERNELSHIYNEEKSEASARAISSRYLAELKNLLVFLKKQ